MSTVQEINVSGAYCVHGRPPYVLCPECAELGRREQREKALYETLDRLAAAVDKLAEKLP